MDARPDAPIVGEIIVTYALTKPDLPLVKKALVRYLDEEQKSQQEIDWLQFEPVPTSWTERHPQLRLQHFRSLVPHLQDHQITILESALTSLRAELQEGELLPFVFLSIRYGLSLSKDAVQPNTGKNLVAITQWCRDIANRLIDDRHAGVGELIVVTTEIVTDAELQTMQKQTRLLQERHEDWEQIVPADARFNEAPPGTREGSGSFAHLLVARNFHAVLGPLSFSKYTGPGWIFHFYESDAFPHGSMKTESINFIDPLREEFHGGYVKHRITGMPVVFGLMQWLGYEQHQTRQVRRKMVQTEERLSAPFLWPPMLFSWRSLVRRTAECRVRLHGLKVIRDEYETAMRAYLEQRRQPPNREVVVLSAEDRAANPAKVPAGPSFELVDAVLGLLSRSLNDGEEAFAYAKAQQEDYKVRLERVLGLSFLLFGLVQLWGILDRKGVWAHLGDLLSRLF